MPELVNSAVSGRFDVMEGEVLLGYVQKLAARRWDYKVEGTLLVGGNRATRAKAVEAMLDARAAHLEGVTLGRPRDSEGRAQSARRSVVKKGAPISHTARSQAALEYLVLKWQTRQQNAVRRALERQAMAEGAVLPDAVQGEGG